MLRLLILLCLFALTITPTIAQSDEAETWEIVERCIGEPVEPPADWSFEGVIFLHSQRGVHGFNSQFDTPYSIAFANRHRTFPFNGAISPDGRWFAVPHGIASTARFHVSATWHYDINQIIVYSTDGRREQHHIPVDAFFLGSDIPQTSIDPVQWINNNEFIYWRSRTLWLFNAFTGENQQYEGEFSPISLNYHSPDTTLREIISSSLNTVSFGQIDDPFSGNSAVVVENLLYIADASQEQLVNICQEWRSGISGAAWSPNGELAISDGERISIINFEDNTHYIAAYHQGSVFDWRVPPEEN